MKVFKILFTVAGLFLLASLLASRGAAHEDGGDLARTNLAATSRLSSEIYISGSTPASYEELPATAYNSSHAEYRIWIY